MRFNHNSQAINEFATAIINNRESFNKVKFNKHVTQTLRCETYNFIGVDGQMSASKPLVFLAIEYGRDAYFKAMVDAGYQLTRRASNGENALMVALRCNNASAVETIMSKASVGDLVASVSTVNQNAISLAAQSGRVDVLEKLLDELTQGSMYLLEQENYAFAISRAFAAAVKSGHLDALKLLFDKVYKHICGRSVVLPTGGHGPLLDLTQLFVSAASKGAVDVMTYLVSKQPSLINAQARHTKQTALHAAASCGQIKAVKWLLNNKANHSLKDVWGKAAAESISPCAPAEQKKQMQALLTAGPTAIRTQSPLLVGGSAQTAVSNFEPDESKSDEGASHSHVSSLS